MINAGESSHETEFVRLEDIDQLDHVRQGLDRLPTREGRPAHHRDGIPDGLCAKSAPVEAADARALEPRVKGCRTERSEGGPLADRTVKGDSF
ncbi:hypothetical protein C1I97_04220 [Streptomyces sp. NTH33]|uniref:DUF6009 family protein n=1 Tax=Streptomyces sp. NTH33 TaxID=1735453 RepID=UPI000DAA2FD9|nr:DUF6009 family protein [Streptomyces sp. NTH33]PZH18108.1 hypothetical protein C1I97_04220 [Streptomyces sp. NTH33]